VFFSHCALNVNDYSGRGLVPIYFWLNPSLFANCMMFVPAVAIAGFSKMAGFTTPPRVLPAEAVQKILEEQRQDVALETRSNRQG